MKRKVIFDMDDPEGTCFDHARALEEGLYEEMTATLVSPIKGMTDVPLRLTDEFIESVLDVTELGVNVGPGTKQKITVVIEYTYDYGVVPEPAPVS